MSKQSQSNIVRIFDTTLRDGEQSPGASLTSAEKVEIARQLRRLGVDIIEAGFPAASPDDHEAVARIAREVGTEDGPVITGLADQGIHKEKNYAKENHHLYLHRGFDSHTGIGRPRPNY